MAQRLREEDKEKEQKKKEKEQMKKEKVRPTRLQRPALAAVVVPSCSVRAATSSVSIGCRCGQGRRGCINLDCSGGGATMLNRFLD